MTQEITQTYNGTITESQQITILLTKMPVSNIVVNLDCYNFSTQQTTDYLITLHYDNDNYDEVNWMYAQYVFSSKQVIVGNIEESNCEFSNITVTYSYNISGVDNILNHLGQIQTPWADNQVYMTGNFNDSNFNNKDGMYKITDLGIKEKVYSYGEALSLITPRDDIDVNECTIIRGTDALYIRFSFKVLTSFVSTGEWLCLTLDPDVFPGLLIGGGGSGTPRYQYSGDADSAGVMFAVYSYPYTVNGRWVIRVSGLGYVRKDKASTGCTSTSYWDYFMNIRIPYHKEAILKAYLNNPVLKDMVVFLYEKTLAYAKYDSSDQTLTFFRDEQDKYTNGQTSGTITYYTGIETTNYTTSGTTTPPWSNQPFTTVIFKDKIKPISCAYWFVSTEGCSNIIGLYLLDTSKVTNMSSMFADLNFDNLPNQSLDLTTFDTSKVTNMFYMFGSDEIRSYNPFTLDLSSFDTSNVTNMSYMFIDQAFVETIYVSDKFVINNVTTSSNMFLNCTSLVGGNGTTYSSSYKDKTYARIDTENTPGYFTEK